MKGKFLAVSLLALMTSNLVNAQQDKLITHFMYDKMSLNPGETGIDGGARSICGVTMYRNQWDKVNGAPNSAVLNVEANLSHISPWLSGLGLSFYHDAIAFTRQNNVLLNYSYPLDIGGAGTLGIGVGVGIINVGMNPSWVPPTNVIDYSLPTQFSSTNLDLSFGLYFKGTQDWYAGISSTHLSESDVKAVGAAGAEGFTSNYSSARHYYVMGGKTLRNIGPGDIDANVLVRTDLIKLSADINARYIWNNIAYGGISYRVSDAVAVLVGWKPLPDFTIGYSYDVTINKLSSYSRGSHEVMLKYCYHLPPIPHATSKHPRWL